MAFNVVSLMSKIEIRSGNRNIQTSKHQQRFCHPGDSAGIVIDRTETRTNCYIKWLGYLLVEICSILKDVFLHTITAPLPSWSCWRSTANVEELE